MFCLVELAEGCYVRQLICTHRMCQINVIVVVALTARNCACNEVMKFFVSGAFLSSPYQWCQGVLTEKDAWKFIQ